MPPPSIKPYPSITPHHTTSHDQPIPPLVSQPPITLTYKTMAEPLSTPRILAPHLDSFTSRIVRLIGQVEQLRGEQAIVDCGGKVTVVLNRDAHLTVGHAVEMVGRVNGDLSVKVLRATDLGSAGSVDFDAINAVVDATHRYKEIFYTAD
ncbi:replication factor A protein 3-domain-containing protein [Amylocarpus encephaloides]|uniref:Replication factor A protein 3-domain-containing protein n=1 Tax=Amylocarpus encephaloides TaxID=45428 RepID=A0A9P8C3W6_9HELO|nr:replication factor A protein 3-domain-containing protein [Amylocarpus encephaloides]